MAENSGKTRWINVVLFFSLALNFFIAGYLVSDTKVFKEMHVKKIMHKRPEIRIVDYFPKKERKEFKRRMFEQRKKIIPVQRGVFLSQKDIFKAISEKMVDEEKLRQAFQKHQSTDNLLQTTVNDIVVKMLMEMDYKTRLSIIKRGKKAHIHRKKMRERWKGDRAHIEGRKMTMPEGGGS
ncbi:MAG: periplasmic heavy metal sensor [Emcibacter sp.]|nr:periplasmic heavy metal sensor [Emcibacter sp.]